MNIIGKICWKEVLLSTLEIGSNRHTHLQRKAFGCSGTNVMKEPSPPSGHARILLPLLANTWAPWTSICWQTGCYKEHWHTDASFFRVWFLIFVFCMISLSYVPKWQTASALSDTLDSTWNIFGILYLKYIIWQHKPQRNAYQITCILKWVYLAEFDLF